MAIDRNIKRPCCDCYRLVRATYENEVGSLLIKHLRRGEVPSSEDGRDANLICGRCGCAFVSYNDADAMARKVFWVGWRAPG